MNKTKRNSIYLESQLHVSVFEEVETKKLEKESFIKVENEPTHSIIVKPKGGLWTSSFIDKKFGSAWIQWCLWNEFRIPTDKKFTSILIHIKKESRICTINSFEDFLALEDKYVRDMKTPSGYEFSYLDFEELAKDFDILHLTERGNSELHDPMFRKPKLKLWLGLNSWDCESSLIMNFDCIESQEYIGKLRFKRME